MNPQIEQLYRIAQKPTRRIIGLMSGTSMDGLDVALCAISGAGSHTQVRLEAFETREFSEDIKEKIRAVFAKKTIDFPHLAMLNPWLGLLHADLVLDCLQKWNIAPSEIDLVASHGQTVMHMPQILHGLVEYPNATLQIGDGDHMAVRTGIITLSDFRQKHCAAGGEGAPLAVYGDYFIFGKKGENRLLLNMGGIANFTYLPADMDADKVFVTDTGPGNTLLDAFMQHFFQKPYDKGAEVARQGSVSQALLAGLKADVFFQKSFPKTTGPELFSKKYVEKAQQDTQTEGLSAADVMATLTRFSAETIAEAILKALDHSKDRDFRVYFSGGGMHNPLLTRWIKDLLPAHFTFGQTDELGISGDAKEAVLFAILANETVAGGQQTFGSREGVPSVTMGKISFPK
jgi:anhydro-N-acetylmuramic acid kinase